MKTRGYSIRARGDESLINRPDIWEQLRSPTTRPSTRKMLANRRSPYMEKNKNFLTRVSREKIPTDPVDKFVEERQGTLLDPLKIRRLPYLGDSATSYTHNPNDSLFVNKLA
jgi:hypothetical protein